MEILLPLGSPAPRLPDRTLSLPYRLALTALVHLSLIILLALLPAPSTHVAGEPSHERVIPDVTRVVFIAIPDPPARAAPAGGGGGGGNRRAGPLPRAQAPGRDRLTMAVARPREAERESRNADSAQQLAIESRALASGTVFVAGLPDAGSPLHADARGRGDGGGFGSGEGTGIGSGRGPGIGPGSGGGLGGGVFRPGGRVSPPVVMTEVRPTYTFDALRARIQGSVRLELIVRRDGVPDEIRVLDSLDPGLDHEAIAAVRRWRFVPGRIGETPVDVLVTIVMDFRVH
jgi:TonB family protein